MNDVYSFKQFLTASGLYSGPLNNNIDNEFVRSARRLEEILHEELLSVVSSAPSMRGLVCRADGSINTSVEDIMRALQLIKSAQDATVDTFDVDEYQHQMPLGLRPAPSGEDMAGQVGDVLESQQIARMQETVPAQLADDGLSDDDLDKFIENLLG